MDPSRGAALAWRAGVLGVPLWALSYAWVPFRNSDPSPAWVWPAVIVGEVGAVVVALVALVVGLRILRHARADGGVRRRALWGTALGASVLFLVVGLNVAFALFG